MWGGEQQDGGGGHLLGVQCVAQVANQIFSRFNTLSLISELSGKFVWHFNTDRY